MTEYLELIIDEIEHDTIFNIKEKYRKDAIRWSKNVSRGIPKNLLDDLITENESMRSLLNSFPYDFFKDPEEREKFIMEVNELYKNYNNSRNR